MLVCAVCGRVLKECFDIFVEAIDESGNECVVCGECAAELEGEENDKA